MFKQVSLLTLLLFILDFNGYTQTYCPATGPSDCSGNWFIDLVKIAGEKNSSINKSSGCDAYVDRTNLVVNVIPGGAYTITVHTSSLASNTGVFIDWDNNGSFAEPGESYYGASAGSDFTIPISPPNGLTAGPRRMRIRATSYIAVPAPCDLQTFGEVEDYTIYYYTALADVPTTTPGTGSYCMASGSPNCAAADGTGGAYPITKVAIIGENSTAINNTTACDVYGNYTNLKVSLNAGTNYTLAITGGNAFGGTATWVDWNEDFDFDDPGEAYLEYNYNIGADALVTVINPPINTTPGLKRMRIRNFGIGAPSPCGVMALGEVEDYTVVLLSPLNPSPACATGQIPANGASSICLGTRFSWAPVTNATKYQFKLIQTSTGTVLNDTVLTSTFFFPKNLTTSTSYKWIVEPINASNVKAVGCDTLTFTTSANLDPIVGILPTFDIINVCIDVPIGISGQTTYGTAPFTYAWDGIVPAHFSSVSSQSTSYLSDSAGSFKILLQVTDVNNCTSIDTAVIKVIAKPNTGVLTSSNNPVCSGNPIDFHLKGTGSSRIFEQTTDQINYGSAVVVVTSDSTFTVNGLAVSTGIRVIETNGFGCSDTSNTVFIDVNLTPAEPFVTADKTNICPGTSANLNVTNYTQDITWYGPIQGSGQQLIVNQAGNYFATYTDAFGCSASSLIFQISLLNQPTKPVIQQKETVACTGDSVTLFIVTDPSNLITWTDDNLSTTDSIEVTTSGTYNVFVSNSDGCINNSSDFSVVFNDKPVLPQLDQIGLACNGNVIQLFASNPDNNLFNWSTGESGTDTILVSNSGQYSVSALNTAGCQSDSSRITVIFLPQPMAPVITVIGSLCDGSLVTLRSNYLENNSWTTNESSQEIMVSTSGSYGVSHTDPNGCTSVVNFVNIQFEAIPSVPTITQVGDSLIASPILPGFTYHWLDATGVLVAQTTGKFKPTIGGNYSLVALSSNNCSSDTSTAFFFSGVGISETNGSNEISIYPQPAKNVLNILTPTQSDGYQLTFIDINGRVLNKQYLNAGLVQLAINLQPGFYLLDIEGNSGKWTRKIIIE